jgi:hypothetical protein
MTMVPNNDTLIYLNAATDPFTNTNGSTMLGRSYYMYTIIGFEL